MDCCKKLGIPKQVRSMLVCETEVKEKRVNTLDKSQTLEFLKEGDFETLNFLAKLMGQKRLDVSPEQFILLNAARGRDWTKGVTLMTNKRKLKFDTARQWVPLQAIENLKLIARGLVSESSDLRYYAKEDMRDVISIFPGIFNIDSPGNFLKLVNMLPAPGEMLDVDPETGNLITRKPKAFKVKERVLSSSPFVLTTKDHLFT